MPKGFTNHACRRLMGATALASLLVAVPGSAQSGQMGILVDPASALPAETEVGCRGVLTGAGHTVAEAGTLSAARHFLPDDSYADAALEALRAQLSLRALFVVDARRQGAEIFLRVRRLEASGVHAAFAPTSGSEAVEAAGRLVATSAREMTSPRAIPVQAPPVQMLRAAPVQAPPIALRLELRWTGDADLNLFMLLPDGTPVNEQSARRAGARFDEEAHYQALTWPTRIPAGAHVVCVTSNGPAEFELRAQVGHESRVVRGERAGAVGLPCRRGGPAHVTDLRTGPR